MMEDGDKIAQRFLLKRLAGEGGMGQIFEALDEETNQIVAIKVFFGSGRSSDSRFYREAQVLASLHHPSIVRYITHGKEDGTSYLAMEWLDGEDLSARLSRGPLSIEESISLLEQVAAALSVAHRAGVIHRDIKPSNIFLVNGNIHQAKLLDFGIAKQGAERLTRMGGLVGTPGYIAPEQARGDSSLDHRADIFSLGCVLFECLAGRPAFIAAHPIAMLAKILLEDAPRIGTIRPETPAALEQLLAMMLSKEPERRPQSSQELTLRLRSAEAAAESAPLGALTDSEQRLLAVILLGPEPTERLEDKTILDEDSHTISELTQSEEDGSAPKRGIPPELHSLVQRFGGGIERLADGSWVVTFVGAKVPTDQASAAASCALALRQRRPGAPLALSVGRGEMIGRWPIGHVIEQTAALLRLSPPTIKKKVLPVRIDENCAGLIDSRFEVDGDEHGLLLLGESSLADGTRTLLGRQSVCVGREQELQSIYSLFHECISQRQRKLAIINASAGVGKSRLRYEIVKKFRANISPPEVLIGRGDPLRTDAAFSFIGSAIRRLCGISPSELPSLQQQRLRARVSRYLPAKLRPRVAAFMGEVAGVSFPEESEPLLNAARQEPLLMGDQIRQAFEEWLVAECSHRPVVFVMEDIHWCDAATIKLLEATLPALASSACFVLAFGRPEVSERFPELFARFEPMTLALAPLSPQACTQLIRAMLGAQMKPSEISVLIERAEGNAFYLEELIRAVSQGVTSLPETVLMMAQSRLASLSDDDRRILRAASIFGASFRLDGLRALLGESSVLALSGQVGSLMERELLVARFARGDLASGAYHSGWIESSAEWDPELVFRHALLREAAYASLTESDRSLGHQLAAQWLLRRSQVEPALLAEHYERGGSFSQATRWYIKAAEKALEGNDYATALQKIERALQCGAEGDERTLCLLLKSAAHRWRSETDKALQNSRSARDAATPNSALWYRACAEIAIASGILSQYQELEALHQMLTAQHPTAEIAGIAARAWVNAAWYLLHAGKYPLADELLERMEELARTHPLLPAAVKARLHEARSFKARFVGDDGTSLDEMSAAAKLYEEAGNARGAVISFTNTGIALASIGAYAESEKLLLSMLPQADKLNLPALRYTIQMVLPKLFLLRGVVPEAERLARGSVAAFAAQKNHRMEASARVVLARALMAQKKTAAALEEAERAVECAASKPPTKAFVLAVLAELQLEAKQSEASRKSASEAMELLRSLGSIEEGEALIRLCYVKALLAAGEQPLALEALVEAHQRVSERAQKFTDQRRREVFLSQIAENAETIALFKSYLQDASTE